MGVLKYFGQKLQSLRTIFSYSIYRENFKRFDEFTAPRFAATGAPRAAGTHTNFANGVRNERK
jgi:hypothetical protein